MTDRRAARTTDPAHSRLGRLASWCYARRWLVLVVWIVALVGVSFMSKAVGSNFQDKFNGGNTESAHAQQFLKDNFKARSGDSIDVVFRTTSPVTSPQNTLAIQSTLQSVANLPHVTGIRSPFDPQFSNQISPGGHIAYGSVQFDKQAQDLNKTTVERVLQNARTTAHTQGLQVEFGGGAVYKAESPKIGSTEFIGILAAIIILLVAFGSIIAMGLPIITALFGIGIGVGIVAVLSHGLIVPTFATQIAAMIGIGVGIDYALFVVTRYRQGLEEGRDPYDAVITSLATAGRAVLFAGCTVVISLLGMMLMGVSFIYGLAFGAIAAVLLVMASALTLLPAMLGFAGRKIDSLHVPKLLHRHTAKPEHSLWWRWSRVVQRRPWVTGGAALTVLVLLALPLFSMHMTFSDAGNDPSSMTTRKAYDLLAEGFGPGVNGPLLVAVDMRGGGHQVPNELANRLRATPGVKVAVPPQVNTSGDAGVVMVIPTTGPQDRKTESLVHHLRNDVVPSVVQGTGARALVGGQTAGGIDASTMMSHRLLWVIGGVVVLSFLLLMAVFRSVAVPLKAAVMNLLSIGAAYGVIVAVFQWGWAKSLVGVSKTMPIDPWIPLMLFTILFGLSMDYEVFLLSRIREEWRRHGNNAQAVADGLATTARVITAAAAIMVCVFGSFVLSDLNVLKVFGLGLAVAVFVDATVVRMILVPSTMEILGNANWWFPRWLDRAVPKLSVEVEPEPPAPAEEPVAPREPEPVGAGTGVA